MNLQIPYSWIKEHVRTTLSPEEFAARLSLSGPSVDRWRVIGESLGGIVVGEVRTIEPHPNADKLRIVKTRVGKHELTIVCGGTNLRVGMKIAVALVGARVKWHGEGDLVVLEKTNIRGVTSHGMICAANEIGLFDAFPHQEREILDLSFVDVAPGTPIVEALELDDTVFEIEVTSNRPDAFSAVGLAREAAAILGAPFLWKSAKPPHPHPPPRGEEGREGVSVDIKLEDPKLCSRYQAAVVTGVRVKPSPWWMQKRLMASGIRPISNIVDITNYVMLEQGQPMHAFDAERLETRNSKLEIRIRTAEKGEKIKALDGNTYTLDSSMLVIADAKRPIAIAGVMGGEETGVTKDTTNIIFEAATFDPVSVRRTARALNLHSDSSLRFEKGLSTESTTPALARAVQLACEIAGGTSASPLFDRRAKPYRATVFPWDPQATTRAIGVEIPIAKMKTILTALGFAVKSAGKKFRVTVPYWRDHDIEASQDLDEEVARLYGLHNVPSKLPDGALSDWPAEPELAWEDRMREVFAGAGFVETYSNSFVSRELLKLAGCDLPTLAVQNPLSEDLAVMRPALYPSLLAIVQENEPREPSGAIFEIAKSYTPRAGALPIETLKLVGAVWSDATLGEQFYRVKGMLEHVKRRWNLSLDFNNRVSGANEKVWHPGRSMGIAGVSGSFGELHPTVIERFGIKRRVAIFEINLMEFVSAAGGTRYEPIAQFPAVRRDISFVISERTTYDEVVVALRGATLLRNFELFDVYRGKVVQDGKKSLAFHLEFADPSRTLTSEEAERAFAALAAKLKQQFGAEVRSI